MTEGMSLLLIFLFNIIYLDISFYAVMIRMEHIDLYGQYFLLDNIKDNITLIIKIRRNTNEYR